MRDIPLTNGGSAIVDDADFDRLSVFAWMRSTSGYALRYERDASGKRRTRLMHRELMGLQFGDHRECDHIDGNRLDNRRANLRECTHAENMRNRKKHAHSKHRYRGIRVDQSGGRIQPRYRALLTIDGRIIRSRWFANDLDAAHAYDALALRHHGDFARLNFPVQAVA